MSSLSFYRQINKLDSAAYVDIISANDKGLKGLTPYKAVLDKKRAHKKSDIVSFYDKKRVVFACLINPDSKNHSHRLEDFRIQGAHLRRYVQREKLHSLNLQFGKTIKKEESLAFIEGFELAGYEFSRYKSKKPTSAFTKLHLQAGSFSQEEIREFQNLLDAVYFTRDIVNEPVITLNATALSNAIVKQGKEKGFKTEILKKNQIEKLKMGGLLGVNRGSDDPPTFNILEYKPAGAVNKNPIVFVGKGVTFDTGGYSLKIGGVMLTMKCDMAGGAAVVGAISAIASNKLPVHVVGLIPATDNRIGHNALVTDDIITMHDGTTVEIQNTDAEGRLILGDALSYAKKYKPELVIDLATLTGAASVITGFYGIAMMSNTNPYNADLKQSGEDVYERCAELPMWREYRDLLKSDIADLRNIGGVTGGSITAAKFLEHFTDYNWIHLDIAGPAFIKEGARDYHVKGGSGVGVRLLYDFVKTFIAKHKKSK
ncbi:MAG: leucyl aminopeptidase family protein [Flavobacteriales bacterium]